MTQMTIDSLCHGASSKQTHLTHLQRVHSFYCLTQTSYSDPQTDSGMVSNTSLVGIYLLFYLFGGL